jgi:hypothetical protein
MRKAFVGGNWKCTGTRSSVQDLVLGLNKLALNPTVDVCVAPTGLHLNMVQDALRKQYLVAAQNCSRTGNGAYTGNASLIYSLVLVFFSVSFVHLVSCPPVHTFVQTQTACVQLYRLMSSAL